MRAIDRRPRVVLASDSEQPSGLGEHMLTLGKALMGETDVTIAFLASQSDLLARARQWGMAVKAIGEEEEFAGWIRHVGVDLLHVHAGIGWEGHGLAATGHAAGIPVIRTEHLPYMLTDSDQQVRFRSELERIAAVIAVSKAAGATFTDQGLDGSKLFVVQNGMFPLRPSCDRAQTRTAMHLSERTVLLTVARFTPQKDHETLLRTMASLRVSHPDILLLLVGDGPELERMQALAGELALEDHIRFVGQRSDIAELMAAADLFVLTSLFEGLPLVLLEAMSIGLPVVASRIGGNIEALGTDHDGLVEPGDIDGFAACISGLLDDPQSAQALGRAERVRFQAQFQADRMAAETSAIYRRVISEQSVEHQEA